MTVEILSPEKKIFSGTADYLQFPGTAGSFGVLRNHAPIISSLNKGIVKLRNGKDEIKFEIEGGFVEVMKNQITVLVEG